MAKDKNIRKPKRSWSNYKKQRERIERDKQRELTIRKQRELQEEKESLDD